jgi:hypothetical protein
MKTRKTSATKLAIAAALFFTLVIALHADTITVTNTNDSGPGSLRQALADANDSDTIDFAVTGTIGLTIGELSVDKSITISGPGADNLAIDGNAKSRVFYVSSGRTVTISDITITNGNPPGSPPDDYGGGIYNDHATLTLNNCTISGNLASVGGGIFNDGFQGNAMLTLNNCAVTGNSIDFSGGGIFNDGQQGGSGTLEITNSTLSGNSALFGGGIANNGFGGNGVVTLKESTLSGNSANQGGGGIYNVGKNFGGGTVSIANTIFKTGAAGQNIINDSGSVTSFGYNLSNDDAAGYLTGPGDQINTDPLLGPLQNNGGSTLTHALLPGSPAIDTGDPSFTPPPLYDQRGPAFDRVANSRLDIGSFEVQGPSPTPTPTPCTGRCEPKPRLRPTPHPRPTPRQ